MNCPKCGTPIENGLSFCTECGTRLDIALEEAAETAANSASETIENIACEAGQSVNNAVETAQGAYTPAEPPASETELPKHEQPAAPAVEPKPYVNAAAFVNNKPASAVKTQQPAAKKSKVNRAPCKPLSTWGFVWRTFLFLIPVLNLILLFSLAFSEGVNENTRSYARSWLIYMLIGALLVVAAAVLWYFFAPQIADFISGFADKLQSFVK